MTPAFHRGAYRCVFAIALLSSFCLSQTRPDASPSPGESQSSSLAPASDPPAATDPPVRSALWHWNGGITFSGFHESTTGWSTLALPAVGYTFNDIFSVDATIPIYMYRLAESRRIRPRPDALLVNQRGELGDVILSFHAQFLPKNFLYAPTLSFTAPTGDEDYGLTTGRVTFDLNNHFERTFGRYTTNVEIGGGDSTTLVNRSVYKTYTSLGPLAHFQIGFGTEFLRRLYFESAAYEQLPIGDQKIYSAYRAGKPTVVTGYNVSEDNGFLNTLDFSIDSHTTLSGYYSRSLRRKIDTVGIGITYVLRGAPREEPEDTAIDELLVK